MLISFISMFPPLISTLFSKTIWLGSKEKITMLSLEKSLMLMELNIMQLKYKFILLLNTQFRVSNMIWKYRLSTKVLKETWKTWQFCLSCSSHNQAKTPLNWQTGTYWTCLTPESLKLWISSKDHWTWWNLFTVKILTLTLLLSPTINTWVVWLPLLVLKM